jgi:signal transduction histidine kinase/tetratricopeptide (TPR) repeat protein
MKKALVPLVLIVCLTRAYSQEQRIKKIEQDIKTHKQQDTLRVNRLNELQSLFTLPLSQADSVAKEALSVSRKLHYDEGEVESLIALSRVIYRKNDQPKARALLDQSIALAQKLDDKTHLSNAYATMSSFNNLTGESKQGLEYAFKAEAAAQKTQNKALIARRQSSISSLYATSVGDYTKAMEWALKGEKNAEDSNDLNALAGSWSSIATIFTNIGDQPNAIAYYKKALDANKKLGNRNLEFNLLNRIGEMYRLTGKYAEAIKAYEEGLEKTQIPYNTELTQSNLADVYVRLNNLPMAFKYGFISLNTAKKINDAEGEEWIDGVLARAYLKSNKPDSAIYYATSGYQKAIHTSTIEFKRDNSEALANAYNAKKDYDNAYKYYRLFISYRDSMSNAEVSNHTNLLQYNYSLAKKQAQITSLSQEKKMQYYFLAGSLGILVIIGVTGAILYKSNRQKQKANILLSRQKQLIEEQRDQTNKALADLQLTQRQLIQSEKMASLGELTAGIAHEIQNPLNFINNFAEVNHEMLDELADELKSDNKDAALALAASIKENEEKIIHHGKRADGIVKGMLQHSRASSNVKELTDINKLADEYLRLAYHGLRAKDKSFNSDLATNFAPELPQINTVPQDIGRVLLNLFTNAFYATQQKKKSGPESYKPVVEVSTSLNGQSIRIKVKDNGIGIPENIRDKILQPFFTTKPTGEGTGLGLSLSYDTVVKGHGGKINIESKDGEGSEFIIDLPLA